MARENTDIHFEAEQKRRRTIIIAIILFLLGISFVIAGTVAYYQTTITGNITGTIARWDFKANNQASSFAITLAPDGNHTDNATLAPDTSGSFSVVMNATDSQLAIDYEVSFSNFLNVPTNLIFYSDANRQTPVDIESATYTLTGTLAAGSTTTKTWYWTWPYGNASSVSVDNADANKTVSFTVNVVGVQKNQ